ncbi:MAG: YebC/PmpR family DNA-binding transcriptional regulator [Caldilineaceae bacterium]|jgi:YebC/PmpR family DNA-binding regulatory protein
MSGHSKWSTIKRKKGANDAARGKIFTKLAREIQIAARGGADPDMNFTLRLAIDRARAENMPKENIEKAVRRGAGLDKDAAEIEEVMYEGYGPHGIAILVQCLTDNRNRTIADVRRAFTRSNGNLGEPNSVAWQFTETGYILFNLFEDDETPRDLDADDIAMAAIEADASDVITSDDAVEVYTERSNFGQVLQALGDAGFTPDESDLIQQPDNLIALSPDEATSVLNLIEALEELDDVSNVYHNLEMTDEVVAQFA